MTKIYANALLSNGEILFWKTGQSKKTVYDFYKDFYYSNINQTEYFDNHDMDIKTMAFEFEEDDSNIINYTFQCLAKDFYTLFDISKDSCGDKPY